jgi:hypothetical protein
VKDFEVVCLRPPATSRNAIINYGKAEERCTRENTSVEAQDQRVKSQRQRSKLMHSDRR